MTEEDDRTKSKFIEDESEFERVNHFKVIFRSKLFYFAAFWVSMMWGLLFIGARMIDTLIISAFAMIFLKIVGEALIYLFDKLAGIVV